MAWNVYDDFEDGTVDDGWNGGLSGWSVGSPSNAPSGTYVAQSDNTTVTSDQFTDSVGVRFWAWALSYGPSAYCWVLDGAGNRLCGIEVADSGEYYITNPDGSNRKQLGTATEDEPEQLLLRWQGGTDWEGELLNLGPISLTAKEPSDAIRAFEIESPDNTFPKWDKFEYDAVEAPAPPNNADATYVSDDQVDFSFDADTTGGPINGYEVQILRDGSTWEDPSGGPSAPTSAGTYSYGPNSDTAYARQVGVDSSFQFRVRANNSTGSSSWSYSDTVYTTAIPPHNPSVSRPDGTSFTFNYTQTSDISSGVVVYARKDTGSGYGSWGWFKTISGGSQTVSQGQAENITIEEDARYQFRLINYVSANRSRDSAPAYADYGTSGSVFFTDDFEDQDLAEWDSTTLSDADSGIASGSFTDLGISGADQGSYYLRLDSGDSVYKQLGDLSGESDVIVKATVATGSMDTASEETLIEFYDGSSWRALRRFGHEYNRQGWVEVTALVPSSYLSTDNFVRFRGYGGGGDHYAVDRVVVSDVLHEFTTPSAPSGLSLDDSTQRELTASWTDNATFEMAHDLDYRRSSDSSWSSASGSTSSPYTQSGLRDGEEYEMRVRSFLQQYRRGSASQYFQSAWVGPVAATTILPAPTVLSSPSHGATTIDISWTNNHNYGNVWAQYRPSGSSTWTTDATLSLSTETHQIVGLRNGEQYDVRVLANTEHTQTEDA